MGLEPTYLHGSEEQTCFLGLVGPRAGCKPVPNPAGGGGGGGRREEEGRRKGMAVAVQGGEERSRSEAWVEEQ